MAKIHTVTLPDIGEGVVEGEVVEWLKNIGAVVAKDEPVVIVMTDKATVELPSPVAGTLHKQYYKPGEIAYKDKPLYEIAVAGTEKETQTATDNATVVTAHDAKKQVPEKAQPKKIQKNTTLQENEKKQPNAKAAASEKNLNKHALATPPVRQMAKALHIDIDQVQGTGQQGRVLADDLSMFLRQMSHEQKAESPPLDISALNDAALQAAEKINIAHIEPLTGIKRLMAHNMARAKAEIPHFAYFENVDASRLVLLKEKVDPQANAAGIVLTFMPFVLRALSLALTKFPLVNSSYNKGEEAIEYHSHQNIGIAMSTRLGLIVPVLKNVESLSLEQIIRNFDDLKKRARSNKLTSNDMKAGTITISNFGVFGGEGQFATPIINPPEAAILAFSRIYKAPAVKCGEILARDTLHLSWSFDHRIIDGSMAATFSHYFTLLLQNPAQLL